MNLSKAIFLSFLKAFSKYSETHFSVYSEKQSLCSYVYYTLRQFKSHPKITLNNVQQRDESVFLVKKINFLKHETIVIMILKI